MIMTFTRTVVSAAIVTVFLYVPLAIAQGGKKGVAGGIIACSDQFAAAIAEAHLPSEKMKALIDYIQCLHVLRLNNPNDKHLAAVLDDISKNKLNDALSGYHTALNKEASSSRRVALFSESSDKDFIDWAKDRVEQGKRDVDRADGAIDKAMAAADTVRDIVGEGVDRVKKAIKDL